MQRPANGSLGFDGFLVLCEISAAKHTVMAAPPGGFAFLQNQRQFRYAGIAAAEMEQLPRIEPGFAAFIPTGAVQQVSTGCVDGFERPQLRPTDLSPIGLATRTLGLA